jgi:hypothetical protein
MALLESPPGLKLLLLYAVTIGLLEPSVCVFLRLSLLVPNLFSFVNKLLQVTYTRNVVDDLGFLNL